MALPPTDNTSAPDVAVTGNRGLRLRIDVLDTLMAAKGVVGSTAQARAFDLERSFWHRIRTGQRMPSVGTALNIAHVAGTTVEFLFERMAVDA